MNIEKEIFKKSCVNFNKLEKYGFEKKEEFYVYEKIFLSESFKAVIKIDKAGNISGDVFDIENNDIYYPLRVENSEGSYIAKVKSEYEKILNDIKEKCFKEKLFIYSQSNRISDIIIKKYGDFPVFMWEKFSTDGVFKNRENNKWYGIIMVIDRSKLDKSQSGEVEIINLKINEEKIKNLLKQEGFYPAWHMNKKYWISVILDETLSDDDILSLVDESYQYTVKNKKLSF